MSEASVLDVLPDAVLQLDAERRIVAANTAATRLTGFSRGDLLGRTCGDVLDARDGDGRPLDRQGWHRSTVLRSVRAFPEQLVTVTRADGRVATLSFTGAYQRGADGRLIGALLCARDRAGSRSATVSGIEMISVVSHELRSPLTSVKGYTSLLLNRWDRLADDQKRKMLQEVNHDADRVTRLITELLDMARLETGRLVLHRQAVDVGHLAGTVMEKVRLEYHDLNAETRLAPGLPRAFADPDKVEQVLTNLVENACKYASPQGLVIAVSVAETQPNFHLAGTTRQLVVTVTDQGAGIPADDIAEVFTKFFHRSEGRPTGSGLGLWISRGLIESHGGRLTATSTVGEGSVFCFTLPVIDFTDSPQSTEPPVRNDPPVPTDPSVPNDPSPAIEAAALTRLSP